MDEQKRNRIMRIVLKVLLCLLIAVSGWKIIQALEEEEVMNALKNFSADCDPKPEEEDMKNIMRNERDVPRSTKCYRLCLTKKVNLLKDCKLDEDNLVNLMEMVFEDKEDEIRQMATACNTKVTCADECDAAHDYAMCLLDEIKARGWPMDAMAF